MNTTTTGSGPDAAKPNGRRPQLGERERVLAEWTATGKKVEDTAAATGWSPYALYR